RLAEVAGGDPGQRSRELDGRQVRVAARAEAELVELRLHRGDHRGVAEAHLVGAVAVKVHVAAALEVLEGDPVRAPQHVEARRGLWAESGAVPRGAGGGSGDPGGPPATPRARRRR